LKKEDEYPTSITDELSPVLAGSEATINTAAHHTQLQFAEARKSPLRADSGLSQEAPYAGRLLSETFSSSSTESAISSHRCILARDSDSSNVSGAIIDWRTGPFGLPAGCDPASV
jgi:hypothetical protein